ncbi:replication-relaxation family protein [Roseovarius phycicola]|uniref:Replication-relaxation family protein n=1 Tax=Roseovarius phycicola TaxID=3080976 RepID=A0ABZ2HJE8_9RHOB
MPQSPGQAKVSLCFRSLAALDAIHRYRYLGVRQVATICDVNLKSSSEMLLRLERGRLLRHFGNVGIRGYGKTPKVYFLKKHGHALLAEEREAQGFEIGSFRQANISTRWSPIMFHRLDTLDVLACVERDCQKLSEYDLIDTLVEFRRERFGRRWRNETTDFVAEGSKPSDKIVPDAGFALRHIESGKIALFLIEIDRGTTRLTTEQDDGDVATYIDKLAQYDRYLASGRIADRHPRLGRFSGFHLLTVTTSARRIDSMRSAATAALSPKFHKYFRFSTLDRVRRNVLHDGWLSRDHADPTNYSLIKGK